MPVAKRKGRTFPAGNVHANALRQRGRADDAADDAFDEFASEVDHARPPPLVAMSCWLPVVILLFVFYVFWSWWEEPLAYAFLPGCVSENTLAQASELGERMLARGAGGQKRTFGTGQQYLSQHSITYLHGPSGQSPALDDIVAALRQIAERAARKQSWPLSPQPLVPRCIELIKYTSSSSALGASNDSESIGWHDDGATHMTVAVPLDARTSYDGGKIEVEHLDGQTSFAWPNRGDAVVWRGWDRHRVLPITRGERNVLVGEFWGQRPSDSWTRMDGRPLEDVDRYREALKLDDRSPALHEGLGVVASKQGNSELAEKSFRRAISLNPRQASAFTGLGVVLQHEDKLSSAMAAIGLGPGSRRITAPARADEAENALQMAMHIDPTMPAAPYDLSLLFERSGRNSEAEAHKQRALRLDPNLLSGTRYAGASDASQLHS